MSDNWLQHVNVKFHARSSQVDISEAITVFHRWIQEQDLPGLLIDVADYQHVPNGPGVMLVAHDAIYSLDQHGGRLGLLYNRRTKLEESPAAVLRSAFQASLEVCRKLENEQEFLGALEFECKSCEVVVNDRALAPNNSKMASQLNHELTSLFDELWGPGEYELKVLGEKRDRLGIEAMASKSFSTTSLLSRL